MRREAKRVAAAVVVVAAVIAVAVLALLVESDATAAALPSPRRPASEEEVDTTSAVASERARSPAETNGETAPAPEEGGEPAEPEAVEEASSGVFGYVFGYRGELLARHVIELVQGDELGRGKRSTAYTDEDGFYTFERVPAGTWTVSYAGAVLRHRDASTVPDMDPSLLDENDLVVNTGPSVVAVGSVTVEPDRRARFDVRLAGTRVFSGTFRRVENPELPGGGNCLIVELRPELDPSTVAASASAVYYTDDPRSGYVELHGLVPDVYLLRVRLDIVGGEGPFVETKVDLTDGDVYAGVQDFTVSEDESDLRFHRLRADER